MSTPAPGPIRCPACGQRALPYQARCLHCNARLDEALPVEDQPQGKVAAPEQVDTAITAGGPTESVYALAEKPTSASHRCPTCGTSLEEQAVLCVQCGYDFRLGKARTTTIERSNHQEHPRRRPQMLDHLPHVLVGLTLHNARILLSLLATLLLLGMMTYASAHLGAVVNELPLWLVVAVLGGVGLWLLGIAFGFAGSILCLFVPSDSAGRLPIVLALSFDLVTLTLGVVGAILGWPPLLAWATGLCSWAFFMVFLVRLADYVDRPSEAQEGRTILRYGVVLIALTAVVSTLAVLAQGVGIGVVMVICLPLLAGAYFRIQFVVLKLLESLRESIRQQLEESRRSGSDAEGVV